MGVPLVLLGALGLWLLRAIPDEQALAARVAAELAARLGVKTRVGALHWQFLPPAVVLENIVTEQPKPIKIVKLTAHLQWRALQQRRLVLTLLELQGASVPQRSLSVLIQGGAALAAGNGGGGGDGEALEAGAVPVARFVFHDLSWINHSGREVVYEGELDFDPQWRPRVAQLRRPGVAPAIFLLTLTRLDQQDEWDAQLLLGGGTAHGRLQLKTGPAGAKGRLQLSGQLQPRAVEVASVMAAFKGRPVVGGKAFGKTTLTAQGNNVAELGQSLHTRTLFSMSSATLLRFDVNKAVRSAGRQYQGQTPLDSVSGQLDTQNTPQGLVARFSQIKVRSGALSASGEATVANRRIEGEFAVDLVDGLVGVPLVVRGPLDAVEVSVPPGALAGAVVGTAVLPGVGTAIGARLGASLGKLFSPKPGQPVKPPPAKNAR